MRKSIPLQCLCAALLLAIAALPAQATIHTVNIDNFFFSPTNTQVNPGDTVRWVWVGGSHSTTADASSAKFWDSGVLSAGSFDVVFTAADSPGPFPYHCTLHPSMQDTIFWAPSADADGDGYAVGVDCHDANASIYPGAPEIPNDGIDQDCDGADAARCYNDLDSDGYGDATDTGIIASLPCPAGKTDNNFDCDDTDPNTYPGATEVPDDGIDQDCDGADATICYVDADSDGWGDNADPGTVEISGICPIGTASVQGDCNDSDSQIYPGQTEVCNGIDDDCDGGIDINAADAITWYRDLDSDGYGDFQDSLIACTMPSGYVANSDDCDDTDAAIVPPCDCCTLRGDFNGDGSLAVSDLTGLINYLFRGGPAPACLDHGDTNADGSIAVSDLTLLINFLFRGGPPPAAC